MLQEISKAIVYGVVKKELRPAVISVLNAEMTAYEAAKELGSVNKQATIRNNVAKVRELIVEWSRDGFDVPLAQTEENFELTIFIKQGQRKYTQNFATVLHDLESLLKYSQHDKNSLITGFEIKKLIRNEEEKIISCTVVASSMMNSRNSVTAACKS
ncbi:TPA: hypothetical protein KDY48_004303 [Vibrio parahaemolyticus]|nr:hypothetical protein [Vibrio parahaemolyticus]HBC3383579.1 hypothetical protein [Vibrio parahaemolyticus]HBC3445569.1 hypothetical protein [Vibrio parahaemolyticus]HBC3845387.1 hypothetical protein [Vibrio parahaemolyticus]HBH7861966.1 hypothetical protein [Vibrio parahaemolyticus]